jgi:hypothetical protein
MSELRDSPVFIAGHPKSGTSLLRSVLDSHPALVAYPEETSFFRRYLPKTAGKSLLQKTVLSDRYLTHIFEWNQVNPPAHQAGFPDRDYSYIPVAKVRRAVNQLVAERFRHDGDMLSAVILAYGQVTGQLTAATRHWVEKTPYNEHYTAQIFAWWPAALMVHTVRDPRDNFTSYRRKHSNWSPEAFAMSWARSTQAGFDNLARYGAEHYWMLRFEDLVIAPEARLRQLCQFLHIDDDPSLRQPARGGKPWAGNSMFEDEHSAISAAPVGRWQATLPAEDVAALEVVAAPWMRRLGYTLSGQVDALVQPIHQNRQYRMRLIGRLLALTLEAKLPQEQAILRTAITILADPSRIDLIDIPTSKALTARWRVFGMLKNVVNLSILFLKETFRK